MSVLLFVFGNLIEKKKKKKTKVNSRMECCKIVDMKNRAISQEAEGLIFAGPIKWVLGYL